MSQAYTETQATGMTRIFRACIYSLRGARAAWRREAAFRQELIAAVLLFPLGWLLGTTGTSRALLIGSVALVLIVELLNTATETVVDLVSPAEHPLAAIAKDTASAAVLTSLLAAIGVWFAVLAT